MKIKFEIKSKDANGKIGKLKINNKTVETPFIFPVVNPKRQLVPPKDIKKLGFQAIITNAYIIYRDANLRDIVVERGIHDFLGFDGLIETDSGSYQMLHYEKQLEITNREIVEFQEKIGVDIGNVLDIPSFGKDYETAKKELEITLQRIREALSVRKTIALNGAIQGDRYKDLRLKAAEEVAKLDVDIFAIGAIVPYLLEYRYKELLEIIGKLLFVLPRDRPIHLFGTGHPLIMPLLAALGGDIFDSASYALYAREDRIITPFRTYRLEDLEYYEINGIPARELKQMPKQEREKHIAIHNLSVLKNEINAIKDAIRNQILWEYVIIKAHSHPSVYAATRFTLEQFYEELKNVDTLSKKRGILYQGELTELRPDLRRAIEMLKSRVLPENYKDVIELAWPFGQIELGELEKDKFIKKLIG